MHPAHRCTNSHNSSMEDIMDLDHSRAMDLVGNMDLLKEVIIGKIGEWALVEGVLLLCVVCWLRVVVWICSFSCARFVRSLQGDFWVLHGFSEKV